MSRQGLGWVIYTWANPIVVRPDAAGCRGRRFSALCAKLTIRAHSSWSPSSSPAARLAATSRFIATSPEATTLTEKQPARSNSSGRNKRNASLLRPMARRELLTSSEREQLLALPRDDGALLRVATLSKEDLAFIGQHRPSESPSKPVERFIKIGCCVWLEKALRPQSSNCRSMRLSAVTPHWWPFWLKPPPR